MVPDHFCLSMFMLVLSLYIAGLKLKKSQLMSSTFSAFLYTLTSGITLSNGVNVYISQLFCNGKKTFKIRNLLLAFVLPTIIMGVLCVYQENEYVKPRAEQGLHIMEKKAQKDKKIAEELAKRKAEAKQQIPSSDKFNLARWIDLSTSRTETIVENLFGEGLYLHKDNLLEDQVESRPVFVVYESLLPYVFIVIVIVLFFIGSFLGYSDTFIKLCLSWFAYDMVLHIVLGFAINEVYIMSAHWMFIIPLCIACLFRQFKRIHMDKAVVALRMALIMLTVIFYVHNLSLMMCYFIHV